jgi:hypothetical protein
LVPLFKSANQQVLHHRTQSGRKMRGPLDSVSIGVFDILLVWFAFLCLLLHKFLLDTYTKKTKKVTVAISGNAFQIKIEH